jgi:hypothetical protein
MAKPRGILKYEVCKQLRRSSKRPARFWLIQFIIRRENAPATGKIVHFRTIHVQNTVHL